MGTTGANKIPAPPHYGPSGELHNIAHNAAPVGGQSPLPVVVMSIAGYDPTAGAGVSADIKTATALKAYGVGVTTAITVQDTVGVKQAVALAPQLVVAQMLALAADLPVAAVKIGMLATAEIALAVAEVLNSWRVINPQLPIVLDPLIYSSSGYPLAAPAVQQVLVEQFFPLLTLITPNLYETEMLTQDRLTNVVDMEAAAAKLARQGLNAILVKGGHLADQAVDVLYTVAEGYTHFPGARLAVNAHGTGCMLAMAITTGLAQGLGLNPAIASAKMFMNRALQAAYPLGQGAHLLAHKL
jgi:hydroxymethylpyrimidine/phosphomethylpyrimidine kinase